MTHLFAIALQVVAVAIVLAVLVAVVTRMLKNPPLAHLLWLLVLVKLVTPPFVHFDLWTSQPEPVTAGTEQTAGPSSAVQPPIADGWQPPVPWSPQFARSDAEPFPAADEPPHPAAADDAQPVAEPEPRITAVTVWDAIAPVLMAIWLGGAALAALLAAFRIVRFHRRLGGALPASQRLQSIADELAKRMGLRRSPDVRIVDGAAAPFVWGIGGRAKVALPLRLLEALDDQQTAMVLAHELAHLRRRDHWVRFIELIASVLHWWNPLVWWVRRQLHAVEEQCCDAWVAWAFPDRGRDYAECLLKAAELSSPRALPVVLASPFLSASTLKKRIEMVMKNRTRRSVSRWGAVCLMMIAAVVIPAGIRSGQAERGDAGNAVSEPAPPNKDAAKAPKAAGTEKPIAKELQPFQGTWKFDACESVVWESRLKVVRTWKWEIRGQQITWIRPGNPSVKLSFTVDASKSPKRIDLRFLDGPHKGARCRGIYEFDKRGLLMVRMTDPGATVARPTKMGFSGDNPSSWLILQDKHKNPAANAGKSKPRPRTVAGKKSVATVGTKNHVGADLFPAKGTFNFERWTSDKWPAKPEEFKTWKWTIRDREIIWTRPKQETVRLSFTVDPTTSPPRFNMTFLNGPDKGKTCLGSYMTCRHQTWVNFQDPGAKVGRPTGFNFLRGKHHSMMTLVPAQILPVADEVKALQGHWKFKIYYSNWWPVRIHHPPAHWSHLRWTIKGNKITWSKLKIKDVTLSFTLDPSKSPRQIDMTFLDGPHKGKKLRGIYRFYPGNTCHICFADPDAKVARPTDVSYSSLKSQTMMSIQKTADEKRTRQTR